MTLIRTRWYGRAISYALLAAMLLGVAPCTLSSAHAGAKNRTVLLFAVADESSSGLPELQKIATDALQMSIDDLKGLECTDFSPTSPLVRRALAEGRVLATQLQTGPTSVPDAVELGYALNVETVVIASIQSYRSTQQPRSVEVIISGQAYDVAANYNEEVGEASSKPAVAQAFGVVGTSRKLPGYRGSDRPLAREAIGEAAYRVARVLSGATISDVAKPTPTPKKKHKNRKILTYVLAIAAIAWLVSESGGDDDAGPSADALPPVPQPLEPEGTDTIRVRWEAPSGTSFEVLRYQIQRRVDDGDWSFFGAGNASADVDRAARSFADFDVATGHSYAYRIRVFYTNSKFSQWAYFQGIAL